MPEPGSNRGYKAWHYIEPILFMLIGGGRHIEELREIIEDEGLRKLTGMKKYFVLPESMRTKTIQSIRWIFIEVAGKVVRHARKLCLKIYAEVEKFILYKKIRLRHAELSG